jgi:hypothetical protein
MDRLAVKERRAGSQMLTSVMGVYEHVGNGIVVVVEST